MIIQNWTALVVGSLQGLWLGFIGVIGSIIGALIVLIIGLIVAAGLSTLMEKIVVFIRLDKALMKLGLQEYFNRAGVSLNSGRFFGRLVYWFFVIVFFLAASDILGFYSLSTFLKETLLYVPNIIVAILILLASFVVANFLRRLVRASVKGANLHSAKFLGTVTWWAIILFGFLTSLSQLGIAVSIINTLVTGFVVMLALAGGIAFGLGGKDYAAHLIGKLREHTE